MLRVERDGMVRVGSVDLPDATRVLRDRGRSGAVAVAVDADVSMAAISALAEQAARSDVRALDLSHGTTRVALRFAPRPDRGSMPGPDTRPPPRDVERSSGDVHLVARPSRCELTVRIARDSNPDDGLRTAVVELLATIHAHAITIVLRAPRASAWGRIAPILTLVNDAAGDRAVRHEVALE